MTLYMWLAQRVLATFPGLPPVKSYDGTDLKSLPGVCCCRPHPINTTRHLHTFLKRVWNAGLVQESIGNCDMDIRRDMYNGVILTGTSAFRACAAHFACPMYAIEWSHDVSVHAGGTALFTGVRERLEKELVEVAPQVAKVKVTSPMNTIERRFSVWIGARLRHLCMLQAATLYVSSQGLFTRWWCWWCVRLELLIFPQVDPFWHRLGLSSKCGCRKANMRSMVPP